MPPRLVFGPGGAASSRPGCGAHGQPGKIDAFHSATRHQGQLRHALILPPLPAPVRHPSASAPRTGTPTRPGRRRPAGMVRGDLQQAGRPVPLAALDADTAMTTPATNPDPVPAYRCICDPTDLFDPPDPRPRAVAGCPAHRARRAAQLFCERLDAEAPPVVEG